MAVDYYVRGYISFGAINAAPAINDANAILLSMALPQLTWNQQGHISDSLDAGWNLRSKLSDSQAISWNTRMALADAIAIGWSVRSLVSDSQSCSWHLCATVSDSQESSWDVRGYVADGVAASWDMQAHVIDYQAGEWDIRNAISDSFSFDWNAYAPVAPQYKKVEWHIAEHLSNFNKRLIWSIDAADKEVAGIIAKIGAPATLLSTTEQSVSITAIY